MQNVVEVERIGKWNKDEAERGVGEYSIQTEMGKVEYTYQRETST